MERIIGTCCWNRRCCRISVQFLVASSCFSRSVHRPAYRARETVAVLQREVPSCIAANLWPHNSTGAGQPCWPQRVSYNAFIGRKCKTKTLWSSVWLTCETVWSKASSTTRSTSGVHDLVHVSMQKGGILNSLCNLHLNFVIKWHLIVTTEVERIVFNIKSLCDNSHYTR